MDYLKWDESMGIGQPVLDEQHKRLVALINDIAAAAEQGATRRELGVLIRAFCDFAQVHFSTEQGLMDSADYPEYFRQVQEHEDCAMQALGFYRDYINGQDVPVQEFLAFVSSWFTGHSLGVDQTLRQYFRLKGGLKSASAAA